MNTETNNHWPVNWSAVIVGGLAALALVLITGLTSIAVGAQIVGHGEHITSWNKVHFGGIVFAICSAFFSFVVGGWVAGRIGGHPLPEPAMLHGAIAWLIAVPMILAFATFGTGAHLGPWYTGLTGSAPLPPHDAAVIIRNNALGAVTALLFGLIGSVLGGWLASGHPMTFSRRHFENANEGATLHSNAAVTRAS